MSTRTSALYTPTACVRAALGCGAADTGEREGFEEEWPPMSSGSGKPRMVRTVGSLDRVAGSW